LYQLRAGLRHRLLAE